MSLQIEVTTATGKGPTALAAFDDALMTAGVSNFNLVRLSSMIPPGSHVRSSSRQSVRGTWGDRLYAVWAFQSAELLGQEAWAGVAWLQAPDDGRGVFVEHEGTSEAQVRHELAASLEAIRLAHGLPDLLPSSAVIGARCDNQPVCALVIAPLAAGSWD